MILIESFTIIFTLNISVLLLHIQLLHSFIPSRNNLYECMPDFGWLNIEFEEIQWSFLVIVFENTTKNAITLSISSLYFCVALN